MRLPSGDQWPSKCGIGSLGMRALSSEPSTFMVHNPILPGGTRVNRNFAPSGDQERCWMKSRNLATRCGSWPVTAALADKTNQRANPNVEIRNPKETRNPKSEISPTGFISDFEFRIGVGIVCGGAASASLRPY